MKHLDDFATVVREAFITTEHTEPVVFQSFALKHQDTFMVADSYGDVTGERDGMFHHDTRVLAHFRLTFGGRAPSLLSMAMGRDNVEFVAHMTNRPLPPLGGPSSPEGVFHVARQRFLWQSRLFERITFHNYGNIVATAPLSISFDADFRDMFEVRGSHRTVRGTLAEPVIGDNSVQLAYVGLDHVRRVSAVSFSVVPTQLAADRADFSVSLAPGDQFELYVEVGPDADATPGPQRYRAALIDARLAMRRHRQHGATLRSSTAQFDAWIERSRADLALLTSDLETGPYPYAGIPWFSTPFGRDGIVTALETLWLDPGLARGVLRYLASRQATETSTFRDASPGKIMHETRKGEMCAVGELPFGVYYGGVDTTPMFVMLAGAYAARTGDMALIDTLWPALCRAIEWVERVRAQSPQGLLDYQRGEKTGLANQGWKDSEDSVFHADGAFPVGPIALVEVQGYAFRAFEVMSDFARRRGDPERAAHWAANAQAVRDAVEEKFWMPEKGCYGIAIGGDGRLCEPLTSNAGHLLFVGLPGAERASQLTETLLDNRFRSGWGIRTLAQGQVRFNPMSYHNGSIWPHDTAICAAGVRRYGDLNGPVELLAALMEAATHFGMRLPELFCGFPRAAGQPPIGYPVACLPQAWSAGAPLMILQAVLGLSFDGWAQTIAIDRPRLPSGLTYLQVRNLRIGAWKVDLTFERVGQEVIVHVDGSPEAAARVTGACVRLRPAGLHARPD